VSLVGGRMGHMMWAGTQAVHASRLAPSKLLAMEAVVRSFPPGSAAGPSGLRPQHLLDCLNSADSTAKAGLQEALLTLVTATSSGRLHPRAAPHLCAARLIPLRKKDGGVRRNAAAALAPLKTAFVKGSPCEVVAMGVQALHAVHGSTGWLSLQVDLKNVFNSIARPAILEALERKCPSLMPWVRQAFQPAPLLVGREGIRSTRGVQHGNPPSPLSVFRGHPSRPGRHAAGGRGYHAQMVLQFLTRVEPMLGCDRHLVVPLATEAGLLDALNAHLPLTLEPLASWTRTGKVELHDGDVRRQHWWSSRVTQVKAAALLEAATGRDVPRLRHSGRARRADGCHPLPQWRARGSASQGPTIPRYSSGTLGCPCYQRIARADRAPYAEGLWTPTATTPCHVRSRDSGIGTLAHKPFLARSLPNPEFHMTARWTSPETDAARRTS